METKILFLDVDGVLNNTETMIEFDEKCINKLKDIVEKTECKIVISSTYRLESSSFNRLWKKLEDFKIIMSQNSLIDYLYTPDFENKTRADEINFVLTKIRDDTRYKIISWIVLDDCNILNDSSPFINQLFTPHFIKINNKTGITEEDSQLAIFLLNN